jgi:hypothetical protein
MARGNMGGGIAGNQRSLNALYGTLQKATQQLERLIQTSGGGTGAMSGNRPGATKPPKKAGGKKYRAGQGQQNTAT